MKTNRSSKLILLTCIGLGVGCLWWLANSKSSHEGNTGKDAAVQTAGRVPTTPEQKAEAGTVKPTDKDKDEAGNAAATGALSAEAANKAVDRQHMKDLRKGIFAFKEKYGHYPEYLSQLVPEFVAADVLHSPQKKNKEGLDRADLDHLDPGNAKPSYGYEFSNLEFRDGRTFAEIKEVQRSEWGDAVPLLRCFAYGKVINISYGGELYETALNWEWDDATLDVVKKHGWGPGLKVGEKARVQVKNADGTPASNAQVWADGRNYSFDLPHRPYQTDDQGWVDIPVGADIDRTRLQLRAVQGDKSSILFEAPPGQIPLTSELYLHDTERLSGTAVDAAGNPLPDTRLQFQTSPTSNDSGFGGQSVLSTVTTDANGNWSVNLPPTDSRGLSVVVGGADMKYNTGTPVDVATALAGKAVISK